MNQTSPAIDAQSPWLGLASFTEETRGFFYGRDEEIAELARRVQRKLLTVLFGQSGLGKTSILRAGLVPRLRAQGYCPVYVRIDYGHEAPEPADQIKAAIAGTARRAGEWSQAGVAIEGESLWEYLHHRDDVLHDADGNTLIPLLIFDQFEEIFTLAQSDDFGRARAARFIADLSDLVENRPPKQLEAKLEADDSAAERFDFARSDYRVLIALREDYLAPLEGLKTQMPSITLNRLRLAPMTGKQALEAVMRPGGALVTEEVAGAIVRFVAGGAEIANAEVEPSLLSLICRELNDARLAQGRDEISMDLLAGTHATILKEFYERALADQPAGVRRVIEDELLTESGFRENVAEERLVAAFAAAGAAPGTLATLVNRRLLRIEERLDARRVELTHDVLCNVVKSSRDLRQERDVRDRTERLLAEQRASELAARRALVRARQVAAGCAVLAVAALVALGFDFLSAERARKAERQAQEIRAAAESARTQAEHLLGYLNDDFSVELAGVGRLSVIEELGKKEVEYYESLPPSLQTQDTARSAALAELHYGIALQNGYDLQASAKRLQHAVDALDRLRAAGDTSEGTAVGLALGLSALADQADREQQPRAKIDDLNKRAVELLRPYAQAPNASVAARRVFGTVATSAGSYARGTEALALIAEAERALASIGALDGSDIGAEADYANSLEFQALTEWRMGRTDDLEATTAQGVALANRVLEVRPGHLKALAARVFLKTLSAGKLIAEMRVSEALARTNEAYADAQLSLQLDPANVDTRGRVARNRAIAANEYRALGRPRMAIPTYRQHIEALRGGANGIAANGDQIVASLTQIAYLYADLGEPASSAAPLKEAKDTCDELERLLGPNNTRFISAIADFQHFLVRLALMSKDTGTALTTAKAERAKLMGTDLTGLFGLELGLLANSAHDLGQAEFQSGDFAAADAAFAAGIHDTADSQLVFDQRDRVRFTVWRTMALAHMGQFPAAQALIGPALAAARIRNAHNRDAEDERLVYAEVLYAQALVDPQHRDALLGEADAAIGALPKEMRELRSTQEWSERIRDERREPLRADAGKRAFTE
jgi:hypothetical protein